MTFIRPCFDAANKLELNVGGWQIGGTDVTATAAQLNTASQMNIGKYQSYVQTTPTTLIVGETGVVFDTLLGGDDTVITTSDNINFVNSGSSTFNYLVNWTVTFAANSVTSAQYQCSAFVAQASLGSYQFGENSSLNQASPAATTISGSTLLTLPAGDSFNIQAYQNSSSSLNSVANYCYLQLIRMTP